MNVDSLEKLREWFDACGKVVYTSTGVWVRGYLEDVFQMIEREKAQAEAKGYERGVKEGKKKRGKK